MDVIGRCAMTRCGERASAWWGRRRERPLVIMRGRCAQTNKVLFNPTAGRMRQEELLLPFIQGHTRQVLARARSPSRQTARALIHTPALFARQSRIDNKKRDMDIHEKRVFGLAKQVSAARADADAVH